MILPPIILGQALLEVQNDHFQMKIDVVSQNYPFPISIIIIAESTSHRDGPPKRSVKLEFPTSSRPPVPVGYKGTFILSKYQYNLSN